MKNPFTRKEKELLASVLPKLADKLVSDGNVKELGEKILWMINHSLECKQYGKEARRTALKFKKNVVIKMNMKL